MQLFFFFAACVNSVNPEEKKFRIAGNSMANTLVEGEIQIFEQEKQYKANDIVALNHVDLLTGKPTKSVFRILGVPGDTVQFICGTIYRNGRLFKLPSSAKKIYSCFKCANKLSELNDDRIEVVYNHNDSLVLNLDEYQVFNIKKRLHLSLVPFCLPSSKIDKIIKFNQSWNIDNFGPLIIPKNLNGIDPTTVVGGTSKLSANDSLYFVVGDNLQSAFDSRNIGLVPKSYLIGKLSKGNANK